MNYSIISIQRDLVGNLAVPKANMKKRGANLRLYISSPNGHRQYGLSKDSFVVLSGRQFELFAFL